MFPQSERKKKCKDLAGIKLLRLHLQVWRGAAFTFLETRVQEVCDWAGASEAHWAGL